jgi:hypothetical protein
MAILHKFLNHNWDNGFYTENSILKNCEYSPEVLIIGTFNHGWEWNPADFFYGRDMYMWTNLANLFIHNSNKIIQKRTAKSNKPTLEEMFGICKKGKIAFAEIIKGTAPNVVTESQNKSVIVNNNEYLWSNYKDFHLNEMGNKGWLEDNVDEICKYVNDNPSIKNIYFTFKSGGKWINKRKKFISDNVISCETCSIFTPTGNGFGENLNKPYEHRSWSITHHWVWNMLEHHHPINNKNYGHLNHIWLIRNGVNPENF